MAIRRNLWPFVPFLVIGVAMAVNGILFLVARRAAPRLVEASPYLATRNEDARQSAIHAFREANLSLTSSARPGGLHISLSGDHIPAGTLRIEHPADPDLDRDQPWADGATSAQVAARSGRWWVVWSSQDGSLSARIPAEAGP